MTARSPRLTRGCRSSRSLPLLERRRRATTGRSRTFHERTSSSSNPSRRSRSMSVCAGVAPDVADRLVVRGPQPRVARNGHQEGAAGPQHPQDVAGTGVVVDQVLEHVERDDEVERAVGDRQQRGVGPHHRQPALGGDQRAVLAVLQRRGRTSRGRAAPGCCRPRPRRRPAPVRASSPRSAVASRCRRSRYHQWRVLERGELAYLSAFHGRSSCQPHRSAPHRRAGRAAGCRGRPTRVVTRGSGRRPRRPTWSWSARAAPIGPRACSFWVEMPISAPKPNSPPSVKRVDALTITAAASTSAVHAPGGGAVLGARSPRCGRCRSAGRARAPRRGSPRRAR